MAPGTITRRLHHAIPRRDPSSSEIRSGDTVMAEDGVLGSVDCVVRSEASAPIYLVVSTGRMLRRRYPVVPVSLVTDVDWQRRLVRIRGRCRTIRRLPETPPLLV